MAEASAKAREKIEASGASDEGRSRNPAAAFKSSGADISDYWPKIERQL